LRAGQYTLANYVKISIIHTQNEGSLGPDFSRLLYVDLEKLEKKWAKK